MEFKYTGQTGFKCMDLVQEGIKKPSDKLINGEVIHVPDDNKFLINKMRVTGLYKEIPKTVKPVKKIKKNDEKED